MRKKKYSVEEPLRDYGSWVVWEDEYCVEMAKFSKRCPDAEARARRLCDELNAADAGRHRESCGKDFGMESNIK
jgi:hypothetical protein